MAEQDQLRNRIEALLALHQKNRPIWIGFIILAIALVAVGIIQLIVLLKIIHLLEVIHASMLS